MNLSKLATGAAVLALSLNAAAAEPAAQSQNQGNVNFVSGGVGEDEAASMQSQAAGYPLQLQFVQKAQPRDEFLSDVKVRITDRSGNVVLDTVSNGPFLLAKVGPGRYQVEADYNGVVKRRSIDVRSGRSQKAVMVWAGADDSRQSMVDSSDTTAALR